MKRAALGFTVLKIYVDFVCVFALKICLRSEKCDANIVFFNIPHAYRDKVAVKVVCVIVFSFFLL